MNGQQDQPGIGFGWIILLAILYILLDRADLIMASQALEGA